MTDRPTQYALDVMSKAIMAGPYVYGTCLRHMTDLTEGCEGHYFDPEAAQRGIDWFEKVLHLGGGKFKLFDWQAFCVGMVFGWKRDDDTRRFRRVYWETAKGSGKTPLAAGVGLYLTTADDEYRAEGYVCARTMEQALVTYRDMAVMVEDTPELMARCRIMGKMNPYAIHFEANRSFIRRLAAQDRGEGRSGYRPHAVIIDEYHEHATSAMVDMMAAGFKSRTQPLMLITTNAGTAMASPCGVEHIYACKIALGELQDDTYFPYVCALDPDDDPDDEECWIKTNPSLPALPGNEYIRDMIATAKGMPSKRAVVDRLIFCKWTDAESPWIDADAYDAVAVDDLEREGECFAALDLSARTDLTAGALVWRHPNGRIEVEVTAWTPADTLPARAIEDQAPYMEWVEAGHLRTVPGAVMDFRPVVQWLKDAIADHQLKSLAYDPWRSDELLREADRCGLTLTRWDDKYPGATNLLIEPHPQGFVAAGKTGLAMPVSIDTSERLMYTGDIAFLRNPVLRSAMLGAVAVRDNSLNRRFVKLKSSTRIDPAVAAVMAIGLATRGEQLSLAGKFIATATAAQQQRDTK